MKRQLLGTLAAALILAGAITDAATRTWNGGSGIWTDTNGVPWSNTSAPTTNDLINLTQATAGNITIDYNGNNPAFLDGTPAVIGSRYGTLTIGNTGGGTTTLRIASGVLPSSNDGNFNAGSRIEISGGVLAPMYQVNFNNATIDQTGGWFKPFYYDFNLNGTTVFNASGGTSECRQLIVAGTSVFNLNPGGTLTLTGNRYTYLQGNGVFNQNGGTMLTDYGTLWLQGGTFNWNTGSYLYGNFYQSGGTFNLTGGTCRVIWEIEVAKGVGQTGVYNYAGGSMGSNSRGLKLGSEGGNGTFYHHGNLFASWVDNNGAVGWLFIGGTNGAGTYYLGDASGSSAIGSVVQSLRIGRTGMLIGRGVVSNAFYGNHELSGKVIANGYNTQTNLDLKELGNLFANYPLFTNAYENVSDKGWYAVNKGQVIFPVVGSVRDSGATYVNAAHGTTYNLGESTFIADNTIDLVNSAQLSFTGLGAGSGVLVGKLLATNRTDIAASAPNKMQFLSVHDLTLSGNTFSDVSVKIRYDHTAFSSPKVDENTIKIWRNNAGTWVDVTASVDTNNRIVTSSSVTALGQFAVTIKIPSRFGTVVAVK
jgi:hypothetical protein